MKNWALSFLFFACFAFLICSCEDKRQVQKLITPSVQNDELESPLIQKNIKILALENEEIELFIKRYGWNMTQTGTGLRYTIIHKGKDKIPQKGEEVTLKYVTQLLSGDTIYTDKTDSLKRFVVEKTDEIVGLHEAVQLMPKGSKAHLVIPAHLAYGVAGDGNKIFGQHPIVMTIELLVDNE
ncbi:MAG TPA: FKBP-type peptidyl-prolyl cis-trans isomerase [Bacteroidales bacterium]|nr:FKBP-type peptidyl-prolyl cis-trans isomerase [Bacteroidales bacterium]